MVINDNPITLLCWWCIGTMVLLLTFLLREQQLKGWYGCQLIPPFSCLSGLYGKRNVFSTRLDPPTWWIELCLGNPWTHMGRIYFYNHRWEWVHGSGHRHWWLGNASPDYQQMYMFGVPYGVYPCIQGHIQRYGISITFHYLWDKCLSAPRLVPFPNSSKLSWLHERFSMGLCLHGFDPDNKSIFLYLRFSL